MLLETGFNDANLNFSVIIKPILVVVLASTSNWILSFPHGLAQGAILFFCKNVFRLGMPRKYFDMPDIGLSGKSVPPVYVQSCVADTHL
jgi:hypothetical protein